MSVRVVIVVLSCSVMSPFVLSFSSSVTQDEQLAATQLPRVNADVEKDRQVKITGIGAGLPTHLYREFFYSYETNYPDVSIAFDETCSLNGICSLTRDCLSPEEPSYVFGSTEVEISKEDRLRHPDLVVFPTMARLVCLLASDNFGICVLIRDQILIIPNVTCRLNGDLQADERLFVPDKPSFVSGSTEVEMSKVARLRHPDIVMFPTMASAIVIIYNLFDVPNLNLSVDQLVKIYSGGITNWNDSAIQATNPHTILPDQDILTVARMDISGDTTILTKSFSKTNENWKTLFGTFYDPNYDETSQYGSSWPARIIDYFAWDSVGMIGIVKSFEYSIGYASLSDATEYELQVAQLYNSRNKLIELGQIINGVKSAMEFQLKFGANDTMVDLSSADSDDAYPMATFAYMIINVSTSPDVSCEQMMQFVNFIEITIMDPHHRTEAALHSMIPLPIAFAAKVQDKVIKKITCRGRNVYDMLQQQIAYQNSLRARVQQIVLSVTIFLVLVIIVMFFVIGIVNRRMHNKIMNAEKIVYQRSDFARISALAERAKTASSDRTVSTVRSKGEADTFVFASNDRPGSSESRQSINSMKNPPDHNSGSQLIANQYHDFSQLHGEISDTCVIFFKAHGSTNAYVYGKNARKNILQLKGQNIKCATLMQLFGVTVLDKAEICYTLYNGESNWKWLNTALKFSKYEISDAVRMVLARDVAKGMTYLHSKRLEHGMLSSVTCFLDARWTIKIGDWFGKRLFELTYGSRGWPAYIRTKFEPYVSGEHIINHEDHVAMQYIDPSILTKSDSVMNDPDHHGDLFSHFADVYSYGLLLIELWTMSEPFPQDPSFFDEVDKRNAGITASKQTFGTLLLKRINPKVPEALPSHIKTVAQMCVAGVSDQRPTFTEIVKLLTNDETTRETNVVETLMRSMEDYVKVLENKVDERTAYLKETTEKMDLLLSTMLPREIIAKLQNGDSVDPEFYDSATVYFSDIVGFTTISATSTPLEVVTMLNSLYSLFDGAIDTFDVYKVETIGDAYMCVSGVPKRNGKLHIREIGLMSILIIEKIKQFTIPHIPQQQLKIRIGINSGSLTAGVVGTKMPRYCLFGDTVLAHYDWPTRTDGLRRDFLAFISGDDIDVNTASRMESTGAAMRIQTTAATAHQLQLHFPDSFNCVRRGKVEIKGKGSMETYWVQHMKDQIPTEQAAGIYRTQHQSTKVPLYKALV